MNSSFPGDGAEYALVNLDTGLQLAGRVRIAGESASRRKGLLGVDSLGDGSGLWIMPCEAIHTFGMKMPIDVVFLDRDFKVRKLLSKMVPYRVAVCLLASSVVELRTGTIAESKTKLGDRLGVQRKSAGYRSREEQPMSLGSTCPPS